MNAEGKKPVGWNKRDGGYKKAYTCDRAVFRRMGRNMIRNTGKKDQLENGQVFWNCWFWEGDLSLCVSLSHTYTYTERESWEREKERERNIGVKGQEKPEIVTVRDGLESPGYAS